MSSSLHGSRLLVPLDGSQQSERALLAAEAIAYATKSTVVLARVLSPARHVQGLQASPTLAEDYADLLAKEEQDAQAYLAQVARRLGEHGVRVETCVRPGRPATTLLALEEELQVHLVVMMTHARAGMALSALGSVAEQLLQRGQVPVLLMHPLVDESRWAALSRAVVPLDGSVLAEAALDVALALAGSVVKDMTLLRVVDSHALTTGRTSAPPDEGKAARTYLENVLARLRAEALPSACVLRAEVITGRPAFAIVAWAKQEHAMIIMATHAEVGTRKLFFGSVADFVLHNADAPILLVHPSGTSTGTAAHAQPDASQHTSAAHPTG